jgi:general stress protein 26
MDLKNKILKLITQSNICYMATVTKENKPWVRYMEINVSDDLIINFATSINSRKVDHIKSNSEVHILCGLNSADQMGDYLQIQGKAEIVTNQDKLKQYWKEDYSRYFQGPTDQNYVQILVRSYVIEYMDAKTWKTEIWRA